MNTQALSPEQEKTLRSIAAGEEPLVHILRVRWLINHRWLIGGQRHGARKRFVVLTPKACAHIGAPFIHYPRVVVIQQPGSVLPARR